ncbi:MAG TPA: endonuclease domain-containing protein [Candidatus Kapabacteria bacterium]|jgi:very-short-patch-repair endonuclease|nr:endonuclease domain-containing protein [Candidatus Kapabacteria bacterium]
MGTIYTRADIKGVRRRLRYDATRAEKVLWQCIRESKVADCKFRRQFSVNQYILDFYSPEARLAIEVDGSSHETEAAKAKDKIRQNLIENLDIEFLRFTDSEVLNTAESCVKIIEAAVRRRTDEFNRVDWYGKERGLSC